MKPLHICLFLTLACAAADDRWTLYRAAIAAADGALRLNETASAQAWLRATPEEHRGWEYRYLKAMSNRSVATLTAHDAAITGLAIDSSGELAATTSDDKTVRVWNAALGTEVAVFQGHMWSPAFRPKTRELAAIGADGTVRVWSLATRREVRKYEASGRAVAWSSDGKYLAASNGALWDFEQDKLVWKSARGFTAIAFHPAKPEFVAATADGLVGIHAFDGEGKPRVDVKLAEVQSLAFLTSGFLVAFREGIVQEFDTANAKLLRTFSGHTRPTNAVTTFKNWIVSGASDQTVRLWNGPQRVVLHGHTAPVNAVGVTSDRILSGDASGRLYWWDAAELTRAENPASVRDFGPPRTGRRPIVNALSFSPDGKLAVSVGSDGRLQLVDSATGEMRARWEEDPLRAVIAWSPDSARLFGGGRLWDAKTGKVERVVRAVSHAAFSKDGRLLLVDSTARQLSFLDLADGAESKVEGVSGSIEAIAVHPNGAAFAVAGSSGSIYLFDTATAKLLRQLDGHTGPVYSLDYSPDGKRLVSVSSDQAVRLWDSATSEILLSIPFESELLMAHFSNDGSKIAVRSTDGRVVILGYR